MDNRTDNYMDNQTNSHLDSQTNNQTDNRLDRPAIPSKEFDCEYSTQWRKEMEFLRAKGVEYAFAKRVGEYKIPTYKYTKTPKLFLALAEFYNQQNYRKNMDAIDKATAKILPLEQGYVEIVPDEAEKKLFEDDTI